MNHDFLKQQYDSFDSDEEVADPLKDEQHVIFDCPEYTYAIKQFSDLFNSSVVMVGHFLNQPDCNCVAKLLTQVRKMRRKLGLV